MSVKAEDEQDGRFLQNEQCCRVQADKGDYVRCVVSCHLCTPTSDLAGFGMIARSFVLAHNCLQCPICTGWVYCRTWRVMAGYQGICRNRDALT